MLQNTALNWFALLCMFGDPLETWNEDTFVIVFDQVEIITWALLVLVSLTIDSRSA